MKVDRLLGIITALLSNDKIKAGNLADKFEVSIRTIYRDIDLICQSGIPIISYRGGGGGIGIAKGYKLDKNALTEDELSNIIIGLKGIDSISGDNSIKLLMDKLSPRMENHLSVKTGNDIIIDLSSFYKESMSNKIDLLRKAIENKYVVNFEYYSRNGISQRVVEPYFITFRWAAWYFFGYCRLRNDFRLFKLNRIGSLDLTQSIFNPRTIPEDRTQFDHYFQNGEQIVTLLLDRSMEYQIVENYGTGSYEIVDDNYIRFNLEYANKEHAIAAILSYGDKVKVISPKHIADEIKNAAENILSKYK